MSWLAILKFLWKLGKHGLDTYQNSVANPLANPSAYPLGILLGELKKYHKNDQLWLDQVILEYDQLNVSTPKEVKR